MKNILFATSEAVPFIKTGGLADVAGSLPKYFDKRYFDIRVILPKYACMKQEWKDKMNYITHFYMDLGYKNCYVGIMHMEYEGIQFYFIDNEYYFSGPKPYDGGTWDLDFDNPLAFASFAQQIQCSPTDQNVVTCPFPRQIIGKAWAISSIQIRSGSGFTGSKCRLVYVVI